MWSQIVTAYFALCLSYFYLFSIYLIQTAKIQTFSESQSPLWITFPIIFFSTKESVIGARFGEREGARNCGVDKNHLLGWEILRTFAVRIIDVLFDLCTRSFNALCDFLSS